MDEFAYIYFYYRWNFKSNENKELKIYGELFYT